MNLDSELNKAYSRVLDLNLELIESRRVIDKREQEIIKLKVLGNDRYMKPSELKEHLEHELQKRSPKAQI